MNACVSWINRHRRLFVLLVVVLLVVLTALEKLISWKFGENSQLANTKWICTVTEDGREQELHFTFDATGRSLIEEYGRQGFLWENDRWYEATLTEDAVELMTGYQILMERNGDQLTITKQTEFTGETVEEWHCTKTDREAESTLDLPEEGLYDLFITAKQMTVANDAVYVATKSVAMMGSTTFDCVVVRTADQAQWVYRFPDVAAKCKLVLQDIDGDGKEEILVHRSFGSFDETRENETVMLQITDEGLKELEDEVSE